MTRAALALLLVLASCGSPQDQGVGGVTREEAQALNDAAAMLDNGGNASEAGDAK